MNNKKLLIPFVTTSISSDLALFFVLLPVWFFLGITQFLGPVLGFVLFFKLALLAVKTRQKINYPVSLSLCVLIFLLASLVSATSIQEFYWIPMFIRNFVVAISAFLLLIVTYNSLKSGSDIKKILWAWSIMAVMASLMGLLVAAGLIPFRHIMTAPIASILPEQISQSEYYSSIINISLGDRIQFFGLSVRRVSSIFPYQNIFAAALIMIIPFQFFLYRHSTGWKKALVWLSIPLFAVNLLLTYSRGALLAIVLSFLFLVYLRIKPLNQRTKRKIVLPGIALLILSILAFSIFGNSFIDKINPKSAEIRNFILVKSIESWKKRPIFGWGTQRNIDAVGGWENRPFKIIPALGSHSQFLSLLYRYGLFGLTVFLLIYAILIRELNRTAKDPPKEKFWRDLSLFCGWAFAANLIHGIFIDMDFDVVVLFMLWMNWAFILLPRKLAEKGEKESI